MVFPVFSPSMSRESFDSLVIPEKIGSDSKNPSIVSAKRSASPSNVHSNTGALRHSASTGSLNSEYSATRSSTKKHAASRYLRASTGSCHDLCKSGIRHSSEENLGIPPWRRSAKPLPGKLNLVQVEVADEHKNEKVVKPKPLAKPKTLSPHIKPLPDTKSHSSKPMTPLDEGKVAKYKPTTDAKNDLRKSKLSLDSKSSFPKKVSSAGTPEIIKTEVFPSGKAEGRVLQGFSRASKVPRQEKKATNPSDQHSAVKSKPVKVTLDRHSSVKSKPIKGTPDQHSSVKSKPVKVTQVLYGGKADVRKERRNNEDAGRNMTAPKVPAKTNLAPPAAAMSTKSLLIRSASSKSTSTVPSDVRPASIKSRESGKLKSVFSPKVENRMGQDKSDTPIVEKVSEKSLPVFKAESEKNICAFMPDGHGESSALLSHEEGTKAVEYNDGEQDKHIDQNDVHSVCDDCDVSPLPSSPESSLADSSSLLSQEEDNKETVYIDSELETPFSDDGESLEIGNMQIVVDGHAVSSSASSPRSLSYAESSSLLSSEKGNAELDYGDGEPDKYIGNDESLEIGNVQSVPYGNAVSSVPSSPKSPSLVESSSLLSHEEEKKEIEYSGCELDKCDNDKSSIITDNCSTSPAKPSLAPNRKDCEEIKYSEGEPHEYISENGSSLEIGNVQSVPDSHDVSFPSPLSPNSWESSSLQPEEECMKEIDYSDDESYQYISENDESIEIGNESSAEGSHHKAHSESGTLISEDKDNSPVKLKFKTGKVIELQPDDNSLRRLKFRRSRSARAEAEDDGEADVRRQMKKSEASGNVSGAETPSEKVVLKHQGLQDKKDDQGLFNNVIEKTASKLVESRKSKVKALVGAFEKVISLQETKPSS